MRNLILFICFLSSVAFGERKTELLGQVRIAGTSTTFTSSARLEVAGTTLGSIPAPRLTTAQRNAVASPVSGLQAYDTTLNAPHFYNGTSWYSLSPLTTKGDIQSFATVPARLGVGTDGQVLTADSGQATGLIWSTLSSAPDQSYELNNLSLSITANAGASTLTVAFKTKAGDDPSAGSPVKIGFRSSTAGTGTYTQRSITTAGSSSLILSSGSTIGHSSGVASFAYVYAVDSNGTVYPAISSSLYDEGSLRSTTTEGGIGGADAFSAIYSTFACTSCPTRLIGRLVSNQTVAGNWGTNPSEISLIPFSTGRAQFVGSAYFAATASCTWTRANTAIGAFGTDTDCPGPTIETQKIGSWQTTDADLPQWTINNLPPGLYVITVTGTSSMSGGAGNTEFALSDGTTTTGTAGGHGTNATTGPMTVTGYFNYSTAGNRTFAVHGSATANSVAIDNSGGNQRLSIFIIRYD